MVTENTKILSGLKWPSDFQHNHESNQAYEIRLKALLPNNQASKWCFFCLLNFKSRGTIAVTEIVVTTKRQSSLGIMFDTEIDTELFGLICIKRVVWHTARKLGGTATKKLSESSEWVYEFSCIHSGDFIIKWINERSDYYEFMSRFWL